jgi:hypothetical protein
MNDTNKHIVDQLVSRAKALAGNRIKNKGRPRDIMPSDEATTVSKMRQRGCSVNSIFSVMREENLTKYPNYPKFKAAWENYRLHA